MKYLKIELKKNRIITKKDFFLTELLFKIIRLFTPKANPDFDDKIGDVKYWLIEFDEEDIPVREIGLDENKKVILKMPYKKNYGYWTDNNLLYNDFINMFSTIKIDGIVFEKKWNINW